MFIVLIHSVTAHVAAVNSSAKRRHHRHYELGLRLALEINEVTTRTAMASFRMKRPISQGNKEGRREIDDM